MVSLLFDKEDKKLYITQLVLLYGECASQGCSVVPQWRNQPGSLLYPLICLCCEVLSMMLNRDVKNNWEMVARRAPFDYSFIFIFFPSRRQSYLFIYFSKASKQECRLLMRRLFY